MINVNVRGTNGCGKSYISKRLREEHAHELVVEPTTAYGKNFKKPNATLIEGGVIIVGREKSGCDGIFPQEIIEELIRYWAPQGHLIWENVLVSGNVGRWADLAAELEPTSHTVWAHLDTPVALCLERIYARRAEAAAEGFKHRSEGIKEDVVEAHWRRCRRSGARGLQQRGLDVRWVNHELSYQLVHDMLVRAGWNCERHGLLLPDGPFLDPWEPTPDELQHVLKTAYLPWEEVPQKAPRARIVREKADPPAGTPAVVPAGMIEPERDVLSDPFVDLGELLGY